MGNPFDAFGQNLFIFHPVLWVDSQPLPSLLGIFCRTNGNPPIHRNGFIKPAGVKLRIIAQKNKLGAFDPPGPEQFQIFFREIFGVVEPFHGRQVSRHLPKIHEYLGGLVFLDGTKDRVIYGYRRLEIERALDPHLDIIFFSSILVLKDIGKPFWDMPSLVTLQWVGINISRSVALPVTRPHDHQAQSKGYRGGCGGRVGSNCVRRGFGGCIRGRGGVGNG